ncbi:amino acid adenylation domain-containing protein [Provencibacterium massiliense]|uniref:amino acid adenylation domain-containing protein n=1 Tax=Provencibacterium massiliense TaxID=1841868 RepID=UPI0009A5DB2B|nr:amino acid adenylation domain-containing protein [Provencibacterium massiliense]RGB67003.1 D-alanine--poly(phosphoribitol) ligase [Harryflintia acetispora]
MNNLIEYLENIVHRFPDKPAYVDEQKSITFGQLLLQGKNIATQILICVKEKINQPIAILMDKSADMIQAYLSVTYSANFYTPLDTTSPVSRLKKIVDVLNPTAILVSDKYVKKAQDIGFSSEKILIYEKVILEAYDELMIKHALDRKLDTDPIYTLFTSGSTGTPKGVTICHRSVIDYIEWVCETFSISENDVFGNQAPLYFDNSILDIYSTLKTGATMCLIPEKLFMFPIKLIEYLNQKRINTIFWVPSALIYVANSGVFNKMKPEHLKKVLFCGEVMPNKQLNIWRKALPEALYANLYGPTEITDACTFFIVDRPMEDNEPLPIGIPCRNTDILVLNDKNELVIGEEKGELCVRGSSLALGYYNNPEKTASSFVQNPLNSHYPELIYRTGDIVKYNENRELIYLCRKDFQIKHMGHRIEIGEIETAVLSLPDVQNGCIIYDDAEDKIVLFYQAIQNIDRDILTALRRLLPKYMLPNRLVQKEKLPMNRNGKIDRVLLKGML